jgi:hypothetical protein
MGLDYFHPAREMALNLKGAAKYSPLHLDLKVAEFIGIRPG